MAIKLTPDKPSDRYARFYFALVADGAGRYRAERRDEEKADEKTSWIEFWAGDAKACKGTMKDMTARWSVLEERKQKRKGDPSTQQMLKEMDEQTTLAGEMLAARVKDWHLVDYEGNVVTEPVTFENTKSAFLTDGPELTQLANACSEFVNADENFTQRANVNS